MVFLILFVDKVIYLFSFSLEFIDTVDITFLNPY